MKKPHRECSPSFRRKPESIFKRNVNIPAFHLPVICKKQSKNKNKGKVKMDSGFRRNDDGLQVEVAQGRFADP